MRRSDVALLCHSCTAPNFIIYAYTPPYLIHRRKNWKLPIITASRTHYPISCRWHDPNRQVYLPNRRQLDRTVRQGISASCAHSSAGTPLASRTSRKFDLVRICWVPDRWRWWRVGNRRVAAPADCDHRMRPTKCCGCPVRCRSVCVEVFNKG